MEWLQYWEAVIRRAWNEAWLLMFPDYSRKTLLRDAVILLVTFGALFALRGPLADRGIIGRADNPLVDDLIPVLTGLVVLVGLFALYFVVEALFIPPFRLWKEKAATPPAAPPRPEDIVPDWLLKELFLHIDADVLKDTGRSKGYGVNRWEQVGIQIRDMFSTGRLKSWGRRPTSGTLFGSRSPLEPIPAEYWREADFTYLFFMRSEGETPSSESGADSESTRLTERKSYFDIHVSSAEGRWVLVKYESDDYPDSPPLATGTSGLSWGREAGGK